MKITKKTIQEMIREELKSLTERPRQLKDKKKEMLVVKNGKVQVIDKKDWKKYEKKGYLVAEKKNLKEFESEFKSYSKYNDDIERVFKTIFGKQIKNVKQTKDGLTKVEFDTSDKNIRDINKASKKSIQKIEKILSKKFKRDVNINAITGGDDYLSYDIFSESVNEAKIVGSYPRRKEPHYSGIPTSKSSTEELVHTYIDTALISGYPFDDEDDNPNFDSGRQQADMKLFSYSQMLKKRGFDRRKLDKLVDTVRKKQTYPKIEENLNEKRVKQAVSGGKVHKFITGKNLTYKGKKYSDIEFELLGIDNREQLVKLKILAPKNLFGQEMNVPFKTIRRGPFIKTDTSK